MEILTLLLVSVALGTDAFALSLGIGMRGITIKQILVLSGTVMIFHVVMPLVGLALGNYLGNLVGNVATVIGSLILFIIGLNMIRENYRSKKTYTLKEANTVLRKPFQTVNVESKEGFFSLMALGASVSMDALTVGVSLGVFKFVIPIALIAMGLTAGVMTASGLVLGQKFGDWLGAKAELAGGIILIIIGIKLLM